MAAVDGERLVENAVRLMRVPSQTGTAGTVADALADILTREGLAVERVEASHPDAPAVVARLDSGAPGRVLQFDGHLDTVHLPFVAPAIAGDRLTGTGAADMKAGLAAAVEAVLALRDSGRLTGGAVLLTAHDLHESPWGDGRQLEGLIRAGYVGDGVLIPEYFNACLALAGRGGLIWSATIRRPGAPIHEVLRPTEPSVISAAADLVARLDRLDRQLATHQHPLAGAESVFVGRIQAGSIFNEFPQECRLEGTRRWLPGTRQEDVHRELSELFAALARDTGTEVVVSYQIMRDAFALDADDFLVEAFQAAFGSLTGGPLPTGGKPFIDDGNTFWTLAGLPVVTHGPVAGGAHTVNEWVSIEDLIRVARVYALTALRYCPA